MFIWNFFWLIRNHFMCTSTFIYPIQYKEKQQDSVSSFCSYWEGSAWTPGYSLTFTDTLSRVSWLGTPRPHLHPQMQSTAKGGNVSSVQHRSCQPSRTFTTSAAGGSSLTPVTLVLKCLCSFHLEDGSRASAPESALMNKFDNINIAWCICLFFWSCCPILNL